MTAHAKAQPVRITVAVTGMTCASCVRRVERALSNHEGVAEASVNFASEEANVAYHPEITKQDELIRVIKEVGYGADVRETTLGVTGAAPPRYAGAVLGRATILPRGALRHGQANMNTLVVIGTSAAYLYSAMVAWRRGCSRPAGPACTLTPRPSDRRNHRRRRAVPEGLVSAIQKERATMTEKTFRVPDMHCGHCKAAVEDELSKIPGVESSNADIEKGTVEVSYDELMVDTEDLEDAIEEAGYTVEA